LLDREAIGEIMRSHHEDPGARHAQTALAREVTRLVHGEENMRIAERVTEILTGKLPVGEAGELMVALRKEIPSVSAGPGASLVEVLVSSGLATSNTDARRLIAGNAISINGAKSTEETISEEMFQNGRLLLRRGKAFKDSAIIEHNG
jgi:tyrosyl-tRNA synthetase